MIFFITGLPRAGSTLLGALLNQNSACAAGMSSPVFSLVNALMNRLSNANEFNAFIDNAQRKRILRGLFESYYADQCDKVIFDTNRYWTPKVNLLLKLFPETKFVCLVRPLAEIVQSFERVFAINPMQLSQLVNYDPDSTIYSRTDQLMVGSGLVGGPLNGLKEAFYGPHSARLMLVSYRNLTSNPQRVLDAIYAFTGAPRYDHDINTISFNGEAYDANLGVSGLHRLRPQVSHKPTPLTLPPDLIARISGPYFWENPNEPSKADTKLARG
ncbi:MAG: sulfotransferase [Alphaproteobacteria bacterium]|nr:sulfotransferase [Alphaproteobacteria bacterium]